MNAWPLLCSLALAGLCLDGCTTDSEPAPSDTSDTVVLSDASDTAVFDVQVPAADSTAADDVPITSGDIVVPGTPSDAPDPTDSTPPDTHETSDVATTPGLTATLNAPADSSGSVILELTPATAGASTTRYVVPLDAPVAIPNLAPGHYGLRAWVDEDDDGVWDGVWANHGEPTAVMGVTLPRSDLVIALRRGVPRPVLDGDPEWVDLYDVAWSLAEGHIQAGTPANGFADHYMDEAFSAQIFQWDTCFMTLFGRQGLDAFPVMGSLENFYGSQRADGYICRVVNESDGQPGGDASDPSEPMINPPLFAWSELLYARQTGDLSRIPRVLPVLEAYHGWLDANVKTGAGLYYTSMLGSGMDNAPRDDAFDGWVDITAQLAFAHRTVAQLATLIGDGARSETAQARADTICADLRAWMWDDAEGFFFDVGWLGELLTDKTLASVWPLLAGCATPEQTARVVAHLTDPAEFWRVHVFPSTAADSPHYAPHGHYWRGGVWAPTTYATIAALAGAGRHDVARTASANHLRNLLQVYRDFVPGPADIADDEGGLGDGLQTLWELYAPDAVRPGTRWDATWLGRQDFVGWTGLGPIALLVEQVIGLTPDAVDDTLTWRLHRTDRHGVERYRFGDQLVDLVARARSDADAPVTLDITTSDPFTLVVLLGDQRFVFDLPAGETSVTATPAASGLSLGLVPAGPFAGYAVLGNGRLSAVYSDDDGGNDPPGVLHLYRGDFGTDLVDGARTLVGVEGARSANQRVGLDPFFATYTEAELPGGGRVAYRAFVGADDAVIVEGVVVAPDAHPVTARVAPVVSLRSSVRIAGHPDGALDVAELGADAGSTTWARLDDGSAIVLAAHPPPTDWATGALTADPITAALGQQVAQNGRQLALQLDVTAAAGEEATFRWVLALGDTLDVARGVAQIVLDHPSALASAREHWTAWAPESGCDRCELAAANLYAARSSSLAGQIPADLTGQFVTNGFPQLYPRDALMVARAFHATGHADAAWEVVRYWLDPAREQKATGEFYARYDAVGRAVDSGSGAPYDVPEWDAQGYAAVLVERLGPEQLSAAEREVLLTSLDFLVAQQDAEGLWTEAGIIEAVGRLPGTTMTSWAGLDAGARLADAWGQPSRAATYRAAAGASRAGLFELVRYDDGPVLADERDGALQYDTSALFGPVWGFPAGRVLDRSYAWIHANARAHGGGVRYFEGLGGGYGEDLFFFTTSAAARYAAILGRREEAEALVDWMAAFTNRYGLAPERVYQAGHGAAEASPLSWCAAELGLALTDMARFDGDAAPLGPSIDGTIDAAEYRASGDAVVDADGLPDAPGDVVVMYASQVGGTLSVGLRLVSHAEPPPTYTIYLSGADGVGPVSLTPRGHALSFLAIPAETPGARAHILLSPADNSCVGEAVDGGTTVPCVEHASGPLGLEARIDVTALGLSGPVQLIAVVGGDLEQRLPDHGSLAPMLQDGTVLVTFEVDAGGALEAGHVVTLSGDRPELGAWAPMAVALNDNGQAGDLVAGDDVWAATVRLPAGGAIAFKYLSGPVQGEATWDGAEFGGDDRVAPVEDINGTGRVRIRSDFGVPGNVLVDP